MSFLISVIYTVNYVNSFSFIKLIIECGDELHSI